LDSIKTAKMIPNNIHKEQKNEEETQDSEELYDDHHEEMFMTEFPETNDL